MWTNATSVQLAREEARVQTVSSLPVVARLTGQSSRRWHPGSSLWPTCTGSPAFASD